MEKTDRLLYGDSYGTKSEDEYLVRRRWNPGPRHGFPVPGRHLEEKTRRHAGGHDPAPGGYETRLYPVPRRLYRGRIRPFATLSMEKDHRPHRGTAAYHQPLEF